MKSLLNQYKDDFKAMNIEIKKLCRLISKIESKSLSTIKRLNEHFDMLDDQDKETVKCLSEDDSLIENLSYGLQLSKDALKQIIQGCYDEYEYKILGLLK